MRSHDSIEPFEAARADLLGLAYRILGSLADAEDAVQDTYLKWSKTDREQIENATAWLTTACTRRCLDLLRAAHRTRVNYVGAWLPEPIHTPVENDLDGKLDLASSLTTAFLLMLERLTPKERAAYLLHEIFEASYPEIAETLDIEQSTCRKLVSRAKSNIDQAKVRHTTPVARQDQLLAAFQAAITSGATAPLASLLASDIQLSADGGGKVPAILNILQGKAEIIEFLWERLHDYWAGHQWVVADINGARGVLLKKDGATTAAVSFAYDEAGKATNIFIVRNPDKLANFGAVAIH
ncbi:MAG: sigma-70 family RNA polymerase sigma factor [Alphaproteobacteria bacterium]|nr:sigma-70 family RNA polymerase sigma factor [Alphaproteobacteria bacterium]